MEQNRKIPLAFFSVIIISLLNINCHSSLCSRVGYDKGNAEGIFGCYYPIARTGGIVGGVFNLHDEHSCIVLTSDSLLKMFQNDTLYRSTRFSVSWQHERNGQQVAEITFDNSGSVFRLGGSWKQDSLWVGPVGVMDAISYLYVKCCR